MKASFDINCPTRILFGIGRRAELKPLLPAPAGKIAFVHGRSGVASGQVLDLLRSYGADIVEIRCGGEPTVETLRQGLVVLKGHQATGIVACGGGAVIDTAKALGALLTTGRDPLDHLSCADPHGLDCPAEVTCVVLPTTAGTGAEVTANAVVGIPDRGIKQSLRGRALFPAAAIVDPELMQTAPRQVALGSGLDAVTQVIEAYLSNAATPFSDAFSQLAIRKGLLALQRVVGNRDQVAWSDMAWVSLSSGLALANGGLGAVHGLAAVIGGQYDIPHGSLCGRLLVPVLLQSSRYTTCRESIGKRLGYCIDEIARVFPATQPGLQLSGLSDWITGQELPRLSDWGVNPADFERLAEKAVGASSSLKNGVPFERRDFLQVLRSAH